MPHCVLLCLVIFILKSASVDLKMFFNNLGNKKLPRLLKNILKNNAADSRINRNNRKILEDLEVRTYCKPLGRPPKDPPSPEVKARMAKAVGERNEVECSLGTGKRIYRANNIRA